MSEDSFNTQEPIAFLITWTTYGTWLPGDERGWHRKGSGVIFPPNELFLAMAQADLKETPFLLTSTDRQIVERTIAEHCDIRRWHLHAVNARSNHVHVVVTAAGYDPETVRDQFKAWATRRLKPHHAGRQRFWTEGASCRSINTRSGLDTAICYTQDAQDQKSKD